MVQYRGGTEFQPAGILQYFEDLKRGANKEIGTKDFFEIASNPPYRLRKQTIPEIRLTAVFLDFLFLLFHFRQNLFNILFFLRILEMFVGPSQLIRCRLTIMLF